MHGESESTVPTAVIRLSIVRNPKLTYQTRVWPIYNLEVDCIALSRFAGLQLRAFANLHYHVSVLVSFSKLTVLYIKMHLTRAVTDLARTQHDAHKEVIGKLLLISELLIRIVRGAITTTLDIN